LGVLFERAATNVNLDSEDLTSANWGQFAQGGGTNPTVTADYGTVDAGIDGYAPDHAITADRVEYAAGADPSTSIRNGNQYTVASGSNYVVSYFVKGVAPADGGTNSGTIFAGDWNAGNGNKCTKTSCSFNSSTWTRCTHTFAADENSGQHRGFAGFMGHRGCAAAGITATDVLVWGMQVEPGTVPTSYVPTGGATVTRNLDTLSSMAAAVAPISTGTIEFDYTPIHATSGTQYILFSNRGGSNIGYTLEITYNNFANQLYLTMGTSTIETAGLSWTDGTKYHIKVAWGAGKACIFRDNVPLVSATLAASTSNNTALYIGSSTSGTASADGRISFFTVHNSGVCP
jgi:hypothetical protein